MIIETTAEDHSALADGRAPRRFRLSDTPIAPPAVLAMLADVAANVRKTFAPASWLIVHDDEVVGLCSITRPPENGVVEIGYGVAPSRQGRGYASDTVMAIVRWARHDPRVIALVAETGVLNPASQRVLLRAGFDRVDERVDDEDGPLIVWRCDTP